MQHFLSVYRVIWFDAKKRYTLPFRVRVICGQQKRTFVPCAAIFISSTCEILPASEFVWNANSGPKRVNYLTYVEWITWMALDYTVLFSHLTCVFFFAFSLMCSTEFRQRTLLSTFLASQSHTLDGNDATDVFARVQRCTMASYVSIRMSAMFVRGWDGVYLPMQKTHVAHCKYDGLAFKRRHISYFNIYILRWIYSWKFWRWRYSGWVLEKWEINKCLNAISTKSQNVNRFRVRRSVLRATTLVSALGRAELLAAGRPMCSLG